MKHERWSCNVSCQLLAALFFSACLTLIWVGEADFSLIFCFLILDEDKAPCQTNCQTAEARLRNQLFRGLPCFLLLFLSSSLILPDPCGSLPGKFCEKGDYRRSQKMREDGSWNKNNSNTDVVSVTVKKMK